MTNRGSRRRPKPSILTAKEEAILQAVFRLGLVTARDIAALLFSLSSITHVREIMTRLAGGDDFVPRAHLYRFPRPAVTKGTKERVYCLGAKGRAVVGQGTSSARPHKQRHLAHSHLMHELCVTRLVCCAALWCRRQTEPNVCLVDYRLGHELAGEIAALAKARSGSETPAGYIVPDGWINFGVEPKPNGDCAFYLPCLIELCRGTEFKRRYKKHVGDRIEFYQAGLYEEIFGLEALRVCYVTTGARPEYRESRVKAMRNWTWELLSRLDLLDWADVFYFTSIEYETLYERSPFSEPVWQTADDETPRFLLAR